MLLLDYKPDFKDLWNYTVNTMDINKVTTDMKINVSWKCKCESIYERQIDRQCKSKYNMCMNCSSKEANKDKKLMNKEEHEMIRKKQKKNTTDIGDETEKYIEALLKCANHEDLEHIERIPINGFADILIKLKGEEKFSCIQVKTLSKRKEISNKYELTIKSHYADKMIIAAVNNKRDIFMVAYVIDFNGIKSTDICPYSKNNKYKNYIFFDEITFIKEIISRLKDSHKIYRIQDMLNDTQVKEYEMFIRLSIACKERNLFFKKNDTTGDYVDVLINNNKIQGKFISYCEDNYSCKIYFHHGTRGNKKKKPYPYHIDDDVQFLIVEIKGTKEDEDKFKGRFLILPKALLIKKQIISTNEIVGSIAFRVKLPEHKNSKSSWTYPYWNNFDQLINSSNINPNSNLNSNPNTSPIESYSDSCISPQNYINENFNFISNSKSITIKSNQITIKSNQLSNADNMDINPYLLKRERDNDNDDNERLNKRKRIENSDNDNNEYDNEYDNDDHNDDNKGDEENDNDKPKDNDKQDNTVDKNAIILPPSDVDYTIIATSFSPLNSLIFKLPVSAKNGYTYCHNKTKAPNGSEVHPQYLLSDMKMLFAPKISKPTTGDYSMVCRFALLPNSPEMKFIDELDSAFLKNALDQQNDIFDREYTDKKGWIEMNFKPLHKKGDWIKYTVNPKKPNSTNKKDMIPVESEGKYDDYFDVNVPIKDNKDENSPLVRKDTFINGFNFAVMSYKNIPKRNIRTDILFQSPENGQCFR